MLATWQTKVGLGLAVLAAVVTAALLNVRVEIGDDGPPPLSEPATDEFAIPELTHEEVGTSRELVIKSYAVQVHCGAVLEVITRDGTDIGGERPLVDEREIDRQCVQEAKPWAEKVGVSGALMLLFAGYAGLRMYRNRPERPRPTGDFLN